MTDPQRSSATLPVKWVTVPERDGQSAPVRKQFADDKITRGKKFEGVFGTDTGVYVVNSFAFTATAPEFSEFTGPTFTSDGEVLFVNIQTPGITLAITGPWEKFLG